MSRKLASIQRIIDIKPIEGADFIERATVLGWHCVIGKGEFKVNDLVVFLEVDSITPQTETYKILKDCGYRVKTRRFKKQVSQGLCLPLSVILDSCNSPTPEISTPNYFAEGTDVTEVLGITKYEPYVPAQLQGQVKGPFPEFLHKTDEERIQTCPQLLEKHKDKKFQVSEKIDGSSCSLFLNNGVFGVCSRNLELKETEGNSYWKIIRELDIERKLMGEVNKLPLNVSLQGELAGPGVQGNKLKLEKLNFFIFNIFDINRNRYLDYNDFKEVVYNLGLTPVPIISEDYLLPKTVDELVEFSKGKSILNKDTHREGIVLRPLLEEYEEDLRGRLSFKCINPLFLLKYENE